MQQVGFRANGGGGGGCPSYVIGGIVCVCVCVWEGGIFRLLFYYYLT